MKAQPHARSPSLLQGIMGCLASLGRVAKIGMLVLLLGGFALNAKAQEIYAEGSVALPRWTQAIGQQLAKLLVSPIDEQRSLAFHLTTYYARFQPELDLEPAVPVLVEIYKDDPEERYRLAAVGALHAIGDENGMQQVRRLVFWESFSLDAQPCQRGPRRDGSDASGLSAEIDLGPRLCRGRARERLTGSAPPAVSQR